MRLAIAVLLTIQGAPYTLFASDPLLEKLVRRLRDGNAEEQRIAANQLGELGAHAVAAVPALVHALESPEDGVQFASAVALGKIGARAVPALVVALRNSRWYVRRAATEALGRMGDDAAAAVPKLVAILAGDPNELVRGCAAWSLGRIATTDPAVTALVEALFADPDGNVRRWATDALRAMRVREVTGLRNIRDRAASYRPSPWPYETPTSSFGAKP